MSRRHSPGASRSGSSSSMIWIVVILVTLVVIGIFALSGLGALAAGRNGSAVEFTLNDFAGKSIHLSDYRGKPVLVNLWASWCPPCRAEMPDLIKFYNTHQADGLVLLAVNSEDDANAAQQFVREKQMAFPALYDPGGTVSRIMGSNGLPSTYLLDRNGNLRFSWTGQISPAILDQRRAVVSPVKIVYYKSLVCPSCIPTNRLIARARREHPEIEIEEIEVLMNLPRVLRDGVLMLPTLIVGAQRFYHASSIEQLLAAFEPSPAS